MRGAHWRGRSLPMEGVAPGAPKRRRPVPGGADALAHRARKKPRAERAARPQTFFLSYDVAETAGWGTRSARPFNVPAPRGPNPARITLPNKYHDALVEAQKLALELKAGSPEQVEEGTARRPPAGRPSATGSADTAEAHSALREERPAPVERRAPESTRAEAGGGGATGVVDRRDGAEQGVAGEEQAKDERERKQADIANWIDNAYESVVSGTLADQDGEITIQHSKRCFPCKLFAASLTGNVLPPVHAIQHRELRDDYPNNGANQTSAAARSGESLRTAGSDESGPRRGQGEEATSSSSDASRDNSPELSWRPREPSPGSGERSPGSSILPGPEPEQSGADTLTCFPLVATNRNGASSNESP